MNVRLRMWTYSLCVHAAPRGAPGGFYEMGPMRDYELGQVGPMRDYEFGPNDWPNLEPGVCVCVCVFVCVCVCVCVCECEM